MTKKTDKPELHHELPKPSGKRPVFIPKPPEQKKKETHKDSFNIASKNLAFRKDKNMQLEHIAKKSGKSMSFAKQLESQSIGAKKDRSK